jgi:Xaa-Pro aminopeptidase
MIDVPAPASGVSAPVSNGEASPLSAPVTPERYRARLSGARKGLRAAGGEALVIGPGADLLYLAGYQAIALERPTLLVVPADDEAVLVVPRLEQEPAERSPAATAGLATVRAWHETEDPYRLVASALGRESGHGPAGPWRLFVGDRLWAMFVLRIAEAFPGAQLRLGSEVVGPLRVHKDPEEIALLRAAAHAADRVVAAIAAGRLIGRSERDVAREVVERLITEGHEGADHEQIVGSGPNSASPHHIAGERVIGAAEPIVFDIGGTLGGYHSDITRTLWVAGPDGGSPDPAYGAIYETVKAAHTAAMSSVRPGIACGAIDRAARDVIDAAGHGPEFLHRTGHGIGLEVHEDPYLVGGNLSSLEAGMAFSIEPGIYLEGRFGARIEDIAVCAEDGADVLNEAPRDLLVVPG